MVKFFGNTADELIAAVVAAGFEPIVKTGRDEWEEDLEWTEIIVHLDDRNYDTRQYFFWSDGDFEYQQIGSKMWDNDLD